MWFKKRFEQYKIAEKIHKDAYVLHFDCSDDKYHYELYRPWGDGDPDFSSISFEIMQTLLAPFCVLTHIHACIYHTKTSIKRGKQPAQSHFPRRYFDALCVNETAGRTYCDGDRNLISLTDGMDLPLMNALVNTEEKEIWGNSDYIYGYQGWPYSYTAYGDWYASLTHSPYVIYMEYRELHDVLFIQVRPEVIARELVVQTIQSVCAAHGKKLSFE